MYKKQADRKKRKNFVPELFERYFRRNEGTTDHATIPEVTLAGDFVIEFDILPINESFHILSGSASNLRLFQSVTENKLEIATTSGFTRFTGLLALNTFSSCKLSRVSGIISLEVNGAELPVFSGAANIGVFAFNQLFNVFGNATSVPRLSGILANLKIWDNGTLIRDYKLNDNSDTLVDFTSDQNGTVINGNADDWGLFQEQSTGEWLGQELSTISSTPLLGDDSDPEFITITSGIILGQTFRIVANFSNSGSAVAGCGWSTSRGVPAAPPFRSTSWVSGDFVGGDFTANSSGIQQLFGRGGAGVASYDNVSVKEVLSVA